MNELIMIKHLLTPSMEFSQIYDYVALEYALLLA
jgi:hypothetical protein